MSSETMAIEARRLGKAYTIYARPIDRLKQFLLPGRQYGRRFSALEDINFALRQGEVLGIVGNNGAGKSTLLQLICGTLKPSAGTLQVNGRIAALLELGAGFNPEFSGRENVFLNAAVLGLSQEEIESRFASIVEFSGIADFIDQPVKTYSSGMYVRLAFAIATAVEPDILVIDEALSVGDGAFARKSFDRIMALRAAGKTILFCSHSMYHIEAICDHAMWLEHGRLRMLDKPETVTRAYAGDLLADARAPSREIDRPPAPPPTLLGSQARLLEVTARADGIDGKLLRLTPGISSLLIDIRFQFDPGLPTPCVAFGLETESGVGVSSGSTLFDGVLPNITVPGVGEVSLALPRLSLMRGKYRLTVFLACERAIHVYDHALHCVELEVIHDCVAQGVCFLPRSWNNGPVITVSGA